MTSQAKAEAFAKEAAIHGWVAETTIGDGGPDHVIVDARRADEHINIFWIDNILTETPKYTILGTTTSLHNKATATRQLALKPNLERVYKRAARNVTVDPAKLDGVELADGALVPTQQPLPFEIWESTDKEILRALRGNRIVFMNYMLGYAQSVLIDKARNMNLLHFNIVQAGEKPARPTGQVLDPDKGRPIVNFVTLHGFRSVALEQILQVN